MQVFLTGATGYIGSVIAEKLVGQGHDVLGLARSDGAVATLAERGIRAVRGDLDEPAGLTPIAAGSDAVMHLAFQWSVDVTATIEAERRVVEALLAGVRGTGKPFVFPGGTSVLGDTGDRIFNEDTPIGPHALGERLETEALVLGAPDCHGIVVRAPNVYGRGDGQALFAALRQAGQPIAAIPFSEGSGDNHWSFVHVDDLADLFVLAMTRTKPHELFHAGAQSGLRTRDIAAALSHGMGWDGRTREMPLSALRPLFPEPALADYWSQNSQSSREKAERLLGWRPQHLDMLAEIARPFSPSLSEGHDMQQQPVALVTGANQGIGHQITKDLAGHGFTVLVGSRDLAKGEAAAREIGPDAHAVQLDVTDQASIDAAAGRVREEFGRLDVLINNAGFARSGGADTPLRQAAKSGRLGKVLLGDMRKMWDTNVFGPLAVTQAMLPLLRESPAARVVNVSSITGSLTRNSDPASEYRKMFGVYGASKTALNAITVGLALDLEADGIKVNAACPGFTRTNLNNYEGTGSVEDAAREPVRLALLDADGPTGTFSNNDGPIPW